MGGLSAGGYTGPTITDNGPSGYVDIGTIRLQWGSVLNSVDSAQTVTFPAAFQSTVYSVSLAPDEIWTSADTGVRPWSWLGKTTSSFQILRDPDVSGSANVDWIAIGRKP